MKTRLDLQDRLDVIDAAAPMMMSTDAGLVMLESSMRELLAGPGVAKADRQWLCDQLRRLCVRQSLPFDITEPCKVQIPVRLVIDSGRA